MSLTPNIPLTDFGLQARVAAFTHTGLVRSRNEDAILVGTWWSGCGLHIMYQAKTSAPN
jgi:serine/threonine protein phosphatase PrpC